jgi:hypothetical protein
MQDNFLTALEVFRQILVLLGNNFQGKYLELLLPPIGSKIMDSNSKIRESVKES